MNEKSQAIALALGGFFALIAGMFGTDKIDWIALVYVGFTMIIGFWNWIEIDKQRCRKDKQGEQDG